jgi:exopolysaccharide biosynthesis protein
MKNFFRKPCRFGIVYSIALISAVAYVLLQAFVIPTSMVKVTKPTVAATGQSLSSSVNTNTSAADSADSTTSAETASAVAATYTDNSYTDENMSITITKSYVYDTQVYIVDIVLSDVSQLKTAFADDTYGRNIKQTTSEMATNNGAILAINGDYYGFRNDGYVIRDGVLYRDTSGDNEDLAIMSDGSFQIAEESDTSASSLLEEGALQVLSFGPALINNGSVVVDENTEVSKAMTSNPRTAIGMISPLHYVIIVSDGRTSESAGLTLYQLAGLFQEQGCTVAYNLDGGGSTTLWFNGEVINNPTDGKSDGEREVSDIVYFGY